VQPGSHDVAVYVPVHVLHEPTTPLLQVAVLYCVSEEQPVPDGAEAAYMVRDHVYSMPWLAATPPYVQPLMHDVAVCEPDHPPHAMPLRASQVPDRDWDCDCEAQLAPDGAEDKYRVRCSYVVWPCATEPQLNDEWCAVQGLPQTAPQANSSHEQPNRPQENAWHSSVCVAQVTRV
tara:strand:+ start:474 stop:1001 length:528 start_codon:yes stop_codon:yes gene_type:complete